MSILSVNRLAELDSRLPENPCPSACHLMELSLILDS